MTERKLGLIEEEMQDLTERIDTTAFDRVLCLRLHVCGALSDDQRHAG